MILPDGARRSIPQTRRAALPPAISRELEAASEAKQSKLQMVRLFEQLQALRVVHALAANAVACVLGGTGQELHAPRTGPGRRWDWLAADGAIGSNLQAAWRQRRVWRSSSRALRFMQASRWGNVAERSATKRRGEREYCCQCRG